MPSLCRLTMFSMMSGRRGPRAPDANPSMADRNKITGGKSSRSDGRLTYPGIRGVTIPLFSWSKTGSGIAKRLKILLWIQDRNQHSSIDVTIPLFTGSESGSGITKKRKIWLQIRIQDKNQNTSTWHHTLYYFSAFLLSVSYPKACLWTDRWRRMPPRWTCRACRGARTCWSAPRGRGHPVPSWYRKIQGGPCDCTLTFVDMESRVACTIALLHGTYKVNLLTMIWLFHVPLSALFCYCSWKLGRYYRAVWGTSKIKSTKCTACGHRMAYRKWKEIKVQPCTAGPGNMLGCSLVSYHFLWAYVRRL